MRLRRRLGFRSSYTGRPRAPKRCGTCHLEGHNAANCQIERRMVELTGDVLWEFHTFDGELPVPANVVPIERGWRVS